MKADIFHNFLAHCQVLFCSFAPVTMNMLKLERVINRCNMRESRPHYHKSLEIESENYQKQ